MSAEISIQQVLSEIRANTEGSFLLKFVRSSGKRKGSIKIVAKAIYGRSKGKVSPIAPRPKAKALHIEKGTIPITDSETNRYMTPLISHIIGFNSFKVKH